MPGFWANFGGPRIFPNPATISHSEELLSSPVTTPEPPRMDRFEGVTPHGMPGFHVETQTTEMIKPSTTTYPTEFTMPKNTETPPSTVSTIELINETHSTTTVISHPDVVTDGNSIIELHTNNTVSGSNASIYELELDSGFGPNEGLPMK